MRVAESYSAPRSGGGFVAGMLWGAAAGVALGLLLAPSTGADFRGQIADSAERFRKRANGKFNDVSGAVGDMVARGRKTYSKALDTVDDLVDRGRDAVDRGREKFAEAQAEAESQFS